MDYSDKLIHFPHRDPPAPNVRERITLEQRIAEYLEKGGIIQRVEGSGIDYTAHWSKKEANRRHFLRTRGNDDITAIIQNSGVLAQQDDEGNGAS